MDPADLAARIDADIADDITPIAVVATAGTTLTGAVDPIAEIADVCEERGVWLHVDGAYGLPAAGAPTTAPRFAGLDRADSLGVDAHKWMFVPKACSAVLVRRTADLAAVFSHNEDYIPHEDDELNAVDTRGVLPMAHAQDLALPLRDDVVTEPDRHALYQGQADAANVWLERAVSLGAQSKLFDALTLALLAMLRHDASDMSGLRAAAAQLAQYRSRFSGSLRLQRLEQGVGVLMALTEGQLEAAVEQLRKMSACVHDDAFDLEAANLLLGLWARAPAEYRSEAGHEGFVRQVGLRFCTGRAITEVLMAAARREEGVVGWLQESQQAVGAVAEQAMERSMAGDAPAAVALLLADARQHFNAKLIDLVLAIGRRALVQGTTSADALQPALDEALQLQTRTCRAANHIAGIQRTGRSPGGLQLRARTPETADATGT
jgi:hypothetical protein